ncbi:MAG: nucleotidyltransferase family protein, partial [Dehalococcoidia bacterium]
MLCARLNLDEGQRAELNALVTGPLSWEQVMDRVQWQMATLVFHHLRGLEDPAAVPAQVLGWFKSAYLSNVGRNLFFEAELKKVLEVLAAEGIPAIPLKG